MRKLSATGPPRGSSWNVSTNSPPRDRLIEYVMRNDADDRNSTATT
jgi:hypothetical protein